METRIDTAHASARVEEKCITKIKFLPFSYLGQENRVHEVYGASIPECDRV